ncbi:Gfo/Idh/MocA family oxidoreductase [Rhizobium sp. CFBP 8762]|uniref:Gfo/Idh/MocA family oxidoreductase n=1 Tax=Rhizobium sp. CFBP 8762 TaxID=2775279 RepID=UPI0017874412|nr:Gfo/Idh/MocA family oxidoreductase [Rhizobium sp. CFBP 8762]MBD8555173.1 Gfo/Idh/MocA family oxidoreductase [Rhizobium sp. CFBP 8762]
MKIGFIGFGAHMREYLLPTWRTFFGVEIAGICDIDPRKRQEAVALCGIRNDIVFDDYRAMMDTTKPDAIVAACYPNEHFRIARESIERSIPVFIEKPLASTMAQVEDLIEQAARKNIVTAVGMNFRFAEVTKRLSEIAGGHFNTISLRQLANKPAGCLWDYTSPLKSFLHAQTIHGLDMLIYLCGPVDKLDVVHDNHGDCIIFTTVMRFSSGAHGSLITSNTSPHFVFDFDAICRDTVHVTARSMWDITVSEIGKTYVNGEQKKWRDSWTPSPLASGFDRSGFRGEIEDFIATIRANRGASGSSTAFATLHETFRCLEEIEAQCQSNPTIVKELAS